MIGLLLLFLLPPITKTLVCLDLLKIIEGGTGNDTKYCKLLTSLDTSLPFFSRLDRSVSILKQAFTAQRLIGCPAVKVFNLD